MQSLFLLTFCNFLVETMEFNEDTKAAPDPEGSDAAFGLSALGAGSGHFRRTRRVISLPRFQP